ncbi:hypothetical protein F443_17467 [Phytophthora nicotianae P1569]|uniref:Uncharacterized protein n=1 Tax=Phytophthora nicotianae P1569 TaxID=1317065 RepID=V9EEI5_PHYNI|nr:hypothetical protein F443_17467 [Phytophthora nicotianae P1569]
MQTETNETETLGALAATCALHLNSMGMLFGDNEELHSRQLSLLEAAASMNPTKTATVIAWGFPAQKIPTRHLKRYKGLRQVVQQSCMDLSLEEKEMHYQQVRTRMRRAFQGTLQSEKLTQNDSDDIDILVNCCCDQEFLQIMSVLAKCPYEVVAVSNDNPPHESSTSTSEPREDSHENDQNVLPVHTKSEETLNRTTDQVQISESSISRDEVMALLQAQTRHLEDRIHAVTSTGRSSSASSHEVVQPEEVIRDVKGLPSELLPHTLDVTSKSAGDLADVQKMARMSLQVRDMSRHRYSSASSDASKQAKPVCKPTQRHDSVRNALKLFRLRQENSGHTTGETEGSAAANENGTPNIGNGDSTKTSRDIECPAASPKPNRQKRDGVKRKPSKNQRSSETQRFLAKEPVYPLRLEYGIEKASLKLLGRNAQQRNPSVKRRQFVHQEHQRTPKTYTPNPKALHDSVESTEVIQLKTASAQTSDSIVPTSAAKEMNESVSTQQNDSGPEKGSPMTQECETAPVNVKSSQNGVGIQCRLNETGPTKGGRRKQSPPPLNIVDKYPVWVDLNGGAHFKEKKYLQVARFGNSNAVDATVTEDTTMPVSVPTVVVRNVNSEDGSDENQSDGQRSPSVSSDQGQENDAAEQLGDTMRTRYRARYRELYPVRERLQSTASVERERTSGINSLIDLRDNMQRMTQRLRVLETCANSIDEEFKVSQKRLSRIGDVVSDGTSPRARVLEDIDEVLEMTEDSGHQERENKPGRSFLSKKASSDMEAAKKLLETIEQLTTSKDDK